MIICAGSSQRAQGFGRPVPTSPDCTPCVIAGCFDTLATRHAATDASEPPRNPRRVNTPHTLPRTPIACVPYTPWIARMLARYGMLRRRSRSMGPRSMAAYEDFNLRLDSRNLPACRRQRELRSAGGAPTRAARGAAAARVLRGYDDVQDGVAP